MTPLQHYAADLQNQGMQPDAAQAEAVALLDALYHQLQEAPQPATGAAAGLRRLFGRTPSSEPVPGLYLWGGVGRGKTYLMDLFYDSLPFEEKLRAHFHRFMRNAHQRLRLHAGEKNPLIKVADDIADSARVICFDEFFVSDITDAMILAGLFERLFERGVTLVATSNIVPDQLYKDGLQRARFLPAIALINRHTQVVNVDGGVDYRLRTLEQAELYHSPLDQAAEEGLERSFLQLMPGDGESGPAMLEIEGREIPARRIADDVVWFDFTAICDGPRSQNDYIEMAREYHTVLIGQVPQMTAQNDDQARRFISMVDEFYDRNVKLVMAAAVALPDLYIGTQLAFEFQRTMSRLQEMQSHEYLSRQHLA